MKTLKFCQCGEHENNFNLLQKMMNLDEHDLHKKNKKSPKLGISNTTVPNSNNPYIDSLIWGGTKWNWSSGDTSKLTYYFGPALGVNNCPPGVSYLHGGNISTSNWKKDEKEAMVVGLKKWTDIIGMGIQEVFNVDDADLKLYITEDPAVFYYGAQNGPHTLPYEGTGIYKRFPGNIWSDSLQPGGFGFITIIHELGHALGLAHPHDNGGGSQVFPGVFNSLDKGDNNLNQIILTVMSYVDISSGVNPGETQDYGFCMGPMAFDIAAIKYLYESSNPSSLNPEDNIYTLSEGSVAGKDGYTCIYDTAGQDMIIYQGTKKVTIDLRPATIQNEFGGGGYISKVDEQSIYSGFTIAQGVKIEDATGGSNDDTFYQVETVSNIIDGMNGIDSVHYEGNFNDYTIVDVLLDGSHVRVSKDSVTDNLYNIERMVFKDGIVETSNIKSPNSSSTDYSEYLSNIPTPIPIRNQIITNDIVIDSNDQQITNLEVVLKNIKHTWVGDLKITLTNVNTGTSVILLREPGSGQWGSDGNDFENVILSDSSSLSIDSIPSGGNKFTGSYYPSNNGNRTYLSVFNGEKINSTWRLIIQDTFAAQDNGKLVEWGLRFQPIEKSSTNQYLEYSSSPGKLINQNNIIITDDIIITNNNQNVSEIEVLLNDIKHTWVGDLKMTLTCNPDTINKSVILMNLPGSGTWGSDGNNFKDTLLSDSASDSIDSIPSGQNYTGSYHPSNNNVKTFLSQLKGLPINSIWRLTIEDTYSPADNGILKKWSLRIKPDKNNVDSIKPTFTSVPKNIIVEATSSSGASVTYPAATATDNVDNDVNISYSHNSGSLFPIGVTNVTVTATDNSGNTTTDTFSITVVDNTSPTFTFVPSNITAEATSPSGALVSYSAATVNDSNVDISYSHSSGSIFPIGITNVSIIATGASGNTATYTFTINVVDSISPTFTSSPNNIIVEATSSSGAQVSYSAATATDSADNSVDISYSHASGSIFPIGKTTITIIATDNSGNTATDTFTITVQDTTSPKFTSVPNNLTSEAASSSGAVVSYPPATATDSTDNSVDISYSHASGSIFPIGVTNVTVTATDNAGNIATEMFTITVKDIPKFVSMSATEGVHNTKAELEITVTWDKNVIIDGTPTLNFSDGTTSSYLSGSGSNRLIFSHNLNVVKVLNIESYSGIITNLNGLAAEQVSGQIGTLKLHIP